MTVYDWERAHFISHTDDEEALARALVYKLVADYSILYEPANAHDDPLANKINELVDVSTVMLNNIKFQVSTIVVPRPLDGDAQVRPVSSGFAIRTADALLASQDICQLSGRALQARGKSNKALANTLTQLEIVGRPIIYKQWSDAALVSGFKAAVFNSHFDATSEKKVAIDINSVNGLRIRHCVDQAIASGQAGILGSFASYSIDVYPADVENLGTSCARLRVFPPYKSSGNGGGKRKKAAVPEKAKSIWGWLPIPQPAI